MSEFENSYPALCFEVGLNCEDCSAASARHVAEVCRGLAPKMVNRLFVQIYPAAACEPMQGHFAFVYREASEAASSHEVASGNHLLASEESAASATAPDTPDLVEYGPVEAAPKAMRAVA